MKKSVMHYKLIKIFQLRYDLDLSNFECDCADLNDFIKNDSLKQQEDKINITKLITCDDEIIGFVSLLTDTIPLKNIRDDTIKLKLKPYFNENIEKVPKNKPLPAIKIGRFAIDKKINPIIGKIGTIQYLNLISI